MTRGVDDHSAELALLGCVLLNVAVFGAAWRLARRRLTTSRSQAACDAALLGFAVQYVAVAGPGVIGVLTPAVVVGVGLAAALAMWVGAGRRRPPVARPVPDVVIALAAFAVALVAAFAWVQADVPVLNNDAITYHFPAAVRWLQRGRLEPFPTWFFNPANGYSPLAGSTLIAWLIVPFGSDVLARFVGVPLLLAVGLGVYRLGREVSESGEVGPGSPRGDAARVSSAAVAVAVVACRPLLDASLMGKDDLLVAFAFVAALAAVAPARLAERWGPARAGLAVGLLLATKYTAALAVVGLLPAVRRPRHLGRWVVAVGVALVVAGPWYLRNGLATGNPVFPLAAGPIFRGLFTTARSDELPSWTAGVRVLVRGDYAVPSKWLVVAVIGWLAAIVRDRGRAWRDPIWRACLVGPPLAVAVFAWRSPFPELRFLFPAVLAMAALSAAWPWVAAALAVVAVATIRESTAGRLAFTLIAAVAAAVAVTVAAVRVWTENRPWRRRLAVAFPIGFVAAVAYVSWTAYTRRLATAWAADGGHWSDRYPQDAPLWQFVNRHLPPTATVAYTDTYLVYPLVGPTLGRRLIYVPTRRGVRTPADLPWLGDHLSGERLVTAAAAATVAEADRDQWAKGLAAAGVGYLVIGNRFAGPEAAWAAADPQHFVPMYAGPGGRVFAVRR